ncbi:hypothetical protein [Vibrio sp. F74]|uniref:hypothetical protein n=1 Tax=Vibrio sp. F74 TaxID=700020 RepID=UPI0035F56B99
MADISVRTILSIKKAYWQIISINNVAMPIPSVGHEDIITKKKGDIMIRTLKIDNLIVQIDNLDKYEIKHLEGYIAKKLKTLNNLYIENSKLTDTELDFIKDLMKNH